jgi:hypothetical protein
MSVHNVPVNDVAGTLCEALDAMQPCEKRSHATRFSEVYPAVEHAISRGVTQKSVLAELQRFGLKLHPTRFKAMLDIERQQRDASGNRVCCDRCGAFLRASASHHATKSTKVEEETL